MDLGSGLPGSPGYSREFIRTSMCILVVKELALAYCQIILFYKMGHAHFVRGIT